MNLLAHLLSEELPKSKEKIATHILVEIVLFLYNPLFFDTTSRDNYIKLLRAYCADHGPVPPFLTTDLLASTDGKRLITKELIIHDYDKSGLKSTLFNSLDVSQVIEEIGYSAMSEIDSFKQLIKSFNRLDEAKIATIIGMMAATHTGLATNDVKEQTWNLDVFVTGICQLYPHLDWMGVLACLDYPTFRINGSRGLHLIIHVYTKATRAAVSILPILLSHTPVLSNGNSL